MSHTIGSILTLLLLLLLLVVTISIPACSAYQCYQCFATDKNDPCVTPPAAPNFTNITCGGLCYYSKVINVSESDGVTTISLDHVVRGCINNNNLQPEMCAQRRQELESETIVTTVCLCMGNHCNSSTRAAGSPPPPLLLLLLLPLGVTAAAAALSAGRPGPFWIT